jgi:hypothetical protein
MTLVAQRWNNPWHGRAAGGADLAHRSGHAVAGQRPVQFPGTKLRSPVGVKDAASDLTAAGDRGLDSGDDNRRAHPLGDRMADDPVREAVLDGAEVKLVLAGAVLR